MFNTYSGPGVWPDSNRFDRKRQAAQRAQRLYQQACSLNWLKWGWSVLRGRSSRLLDLAEIKAACVSLDYRHIGEQKVRLSQIRGSSSRARCYDFDADFRPLNAHNRNRWLGVATAWHLGKKLPAVELIQVGEAYFVEDGHHRISVARALGQQEIAAKVTVWKKDEPSDRVTVIT
jgi:hypothetical protein